MNAEHRRTMRARSMLLNATVARHPYLARKGFPQHFGFVAKGNRLVVPVLSERGAGEVGGVQIIEEDGTKHFPGGQLEGGAHRLGAGGGGIWYVLDYVSGLSVQAGLRLLGRTGDRVVVAFSSDNLPKVTGESGGRDRGWRSGGACASARRRGRGFPTGCLLTAGTPTTSIAGTGHRRSPIGWPRSFALRRGNLS